MQRPRLNPPNLPPPSSVITKASLVQFTITAVIGLSLRVLYLRQISSDIFTRNLIIDAKFYDEWALGLLRGAWNSKEVFHQDPLYAYFLAGCYAIFGHEPSMVRFVQALLDVGTLGLLYVLGSMLFNARTGVIAALLAALYGPMVYYC